MKTFARVQDGLVSELILINEDQDITEMFHPSMIWVDASNVEGVCENWLATNDNGVWLFAENVDSAATPEEIYATNRSNQSALQAQASTSMTPLLLSLQLGDATEVETSLAKSWQAYSRALKEVDLNVQNPAWPSPPA
ncbi:tail fiber assembly protein [Pseudomonas atacamensis]|uniref:tail fiber assembly protein n=1 Tax=Pseudomonas atacamensis TaxID=2565368 RepID=UPI00300F25F5